MNPFPVLIVLFLAYAKASKQETNILWSRRRLKNPYRYPSVISSASKTRTLLATRSFGRSKKRHGCWAHIQRQLLLLRGGDHVDDNDYYQRRQVDTSIRQILGDDEESSTMLPTGRVVTSHRRSAHNSLLWYVPFLVCVLSFWSFPWTSKSLFLFLQWASSGSWIPSTEEEVTLQTNVVTQVVNGPVITSISVLFASLVSLTISHLHSRQVTIHKSLVNEVHNLRQLKSLLTSPVALEAIGVFRLTQAVMLVNQHSEDLFSTKNSTPLERQNAHAYIESVLPGLLQWCIDHELVSSSQPQKEPRGRRGILRSRDSSSSTMQSTAATAKIIATQVHQLVQKLMECRGDRWMALEAAPFPAVHYLTLVLLALSIGVSFLVATAQAEFIFLRGMPVRILWSVLITSFTALFAVLYDLARPFGGAYQVV